MSNFTDTLDIRKLSGGRYKLLKSFVYHVGDKNSLEVIRVPIGFICDGASIPRLLWSVVGHPMDEYAQAAFLHDFICKCMRDTYNRLEGEEIMYEAMGVLGVSLWKRWVIYKALRLFGWYMYNKKEPV